MTASADLPARPPRIPKLTYRNQLPPADSDSTSSLNLPFEARSTNSSDLSLAPRPSNSTIESATGSLLSRTSTSSSAPSISSLASSNGSTSKTSRSSKKKKNGVLSFLTVKEPSQVALDQFMKQQRQQTATKTVHKNTVGLQSISTQKLPSTVPKVNSKWDGVPGAAKSSRASPASSQRNSSSSHGGRPMHGFGSGINNSAFSVATLASRGPPPSLSSAVDVTGRTLDPASETSSLASPSVSSLPEMSCYFPVQTHMMSGALPATSHPWSPPPAPRDAESQDALPDSETKPVEPTDELVNTKADAIFRKLKGSRTFMAGEAQEVFGEDDDDDRESVPETHGFLFDFQAADDRPISIASSSSSSSSSSFNFPISSSPIPTAQDPQLGDRPARSSANSFSRPRPFRLSSHKTTSSSLPTLYEVSIASTETITELSETTANTRLSMDTDAETVSISDSVAPSVMSASWYRSSKDRLGLGSRLSKAEVLPWEEDGKAEKGKPKRGRLSVFSKKS